MLQSPFNSFLKKVENKITIALLIANMILIFVMRFFNSILENSGHNKGIVSFELAKDLSASRAILDSWDVLAKTAAGMSLGFDFLFLIVYALFISILIHKLNELIWKHSKMYKLGIILIWGTFLAAFFDCIENIALIKLLLGDLHQKWSSMAYYFAISKFTLLLTGLVFIFLSSTILIIKQIIQKK